ncbi:hypothetical protein CC86DRAFT_255780, partial [Ophiobolus disseminans]
KKQQTSSSSGEKKRRDGPDDPLRGKGKAVVAEVSEKRRSSSTHRKRRSADSGTTRSPRREKDEHRPRSQPHHDEVYQSRETYRPALNVQVPEMWHRTVDPGSTNSSQEALLNPRPQRSQHQRQRHPKRTSQTTLHGRGAKRDPPRHSKSKKNLRPEPSRGWSLFAPSPPKTPRREHRNYQTLDTSPRSHRSSRQHRSPQAAPESSPRSQTRHRSSRQHEREAPSSRQGRSRTPNTAARRVPDRRFAVLAATNQALETVRREAFAQPSPPPRRERLRRYEGVTIPSSQIPFSWDCVSSTQTSAGRGSTAGEPSSRQRRTRR